MVDSQAFGYINSLLQPGSILRNILNKCVAKNYIKGKQIARVNYILP